MLLLMNERIALSLDLENLLHPYRAAGHLAAGVTHLARLVVAYEASGEVVAKVGICDRSLQRQTAFELGRVGLRVFGHDDSEPDAADHLLLEYMATSLPRSVTTVVIGSGDHIFAGSAAMLRARGKRVEVLAPARRLSHELYRAVDSVTIFEPEAADWPSAA
jgi:hypothetical protein